METRYLPLFVYGTLLPGSRGYGSTLQGAVAEQAKAFLPKASLYIGPSYPFAVRDKEGSGVHGAVILIERARFNDLLIELDEYEGYVGEGRSDNLYIRSVVEVDILGNIEEGDPELYWQGSNKPKAYAYFATPETVERLQGEVKLSPSGNWHNHDIEWDPSEFEYDIDADDNFDEDYPDDIIDVETRVDNDDDFDDDDFDDQANIKHIQTSKDGTVPKDKRNFRKFDEFDPEDEILKNLRERELQTKYKEASYDENDEQS
ncbi:MAG: gamma-glutamylcyclotransferase family protein [Actinomycetaceae bacterium]|nr:gamma-glutamylcyclotransferase family protein [Actinomycetaceae bacterium]